MISSEHSFLFELTLKKRGQCTLDLSVFGTIYFGLGFLPSRKNTKEHPYTAGVGFTGTEIKDQCKGKTIEEQCIGACFLRIVAMKRRDGEQGCRNQPGFPVIKFPAQQVKERDSTGAGKGRNETQYCFTGSEIQHDMLDPVKCRGISSPRSDK